MIIVTTGCDVRRGIAVAHRERPMLSIYDGNRSLNRRQLLSIGSLGLAGLGLPSLLRASGTSPAHVTGKSVIFLFQQGGPSQFETFDPKVDAPDAIKSL